MRDGGPPRLRADVLHDVPAWLNQLRARGNDLSRARDWRGLWDAREELATDEVFWADLWGPFCAVAARHLGEAGSVELLDALIDGGFTQPELLGGELEAAFGDDPRWPALAARLAATPSPPWLELTAWPETPPSRPLQLFALDAGRAAALRGLLPATTGTAWEVARSLTDWVSRRWVHADAHMDVDDAVACLERVDAGERFACVEYALVLAQALNAVGIPSRRLLLRQARYDVGLGHGHVVAEAWVDELAGWVVLDAQNACYWTDPGGTPLSAPALQAMHAARVPAALTPVVPGAEAPDEDARAWWQSYFASVSTTGGTWSRGAFLPVFQRDGAVVADPLLSAPDALYPDLAHLEVAAIVADGAPAVRVAPAHPYATGIRATDPERGVRTEVAAADPVLVLDLAAGDHEVELATVTPYAVLEPRRLAYTVRR
jgi:hypothetical protein